MNSENSTQATLAILVLFVFHSLLTIHCKVSRYSLQKSFVTRCKVTPFTYYSFQIHLIFLINSLNSLRLSTLSKKEALIQVFACEHTCIFEIFKHICSEEHLGTTAPDCSRKPDTKLNTVFTYSHMKMYPQNSCFFNLTEDRKTFVSSCSQRKNVSV